MQIHTGKNKKTVHKRDRFPHTENSLEAEVLKAGKIRCIKSEFSGFTSKLRLIFHETLDRNSACSIFNLHNIHSLIELTYINGVGAYFS